jgi:transposase
MLDNGISSGEKWRTACAGWCAREPAFRRRPQDLPPWSLVSQQTQRWLEATCFESRVEQLRRWVRGVKGRQGQPSAAIGASRVLPSTPERGGHAGSDGAKRRTGSQGHGAVDTRGHLLTLLVTPAHEQDRAQVGELAQRVQEGTGQSVDLAFVDQADTGDAAAEAAASQGIQLAVVKLPQAKHGLVLGPRRWLGERSLAWVARVRRLARD